MQLKEGTEIQNGKYRIIRVLGQGGFGITYLAEHTMLDKLVAIKEFFPKDFCGRDNTSHMTLGTQNNAETVEKLKARFLKEAKNIAKLDHPGIIKIYDIFEENNTAYYVMDYIEGENLNDMVKRQGPLSEAKAVEYIRKVGDALDYIHSRNMTHFDVKPANIMVRRNDDQPILIDFGLSKQYDAHGDATSTLMQGVSHGYSPIELYNLSSISSFSPQTDVYSLGATLYFLLTGNVPPSASDILENGITIPSDISDSNATAIQNAMFISRIKRPKCISYFVEQLSIQGKNYNSFQKPVAQINEETVFINQEPDQNESEKSDSGQNYVQISDNKSKIEKYIIVEIVICMLIFIGVALFYKSTPASDTDNSTESTPQRIISYSLKDKIHNNETELSLKKHYPEKIISEPDGYICGHGYIDLGLSSGTKWATCNVGASFAEQGGDYYSWGDISKKSSFRGESNDNATISQLRSSGIIGRNYNLTLQYDVAYNNWNGTWRIPTKMEFLELESECSWSWCNYNGQCGYIIKGPNDNSIFLPAAGSMVDPWVLYDQKVGLYWSSTPGKDSSVNSYCLHFTNDGYKVIWSSRRRGYSVRPVSSF